MAAVAAAPSSCGSALAASASSSSSSRRFCVGRSLRVPSYSGTGRFAPLSVRATTSTEEPATTTTTSTPTVSVTSTTEETSLQTDELIADLKAKWDAIENKTNVLIYGGGALVALWFSSTIVGAVNSVPLLPKVLELVGLGYSGWFVYRYLLFKESRKELAVEIEELKGKITGAVKE
ncbi:hypothetical protein GOP47_0000363 [Adiantum capillus-veneris]|uniref:Cyanobacterial aminoacyl-tRNA synthetase CAAD domain-containing protein n=1 Tax=Adiantum capillus-veneris TaxID=13818 RepID=A0A9D4VD66_ADICA|nr:hypothetical protein GOP47_0000363 [Adiantum capillus-veneris]